MNRFDFYPGDFLADTADLSPGEVGIYVRLLCVYYRKEEAISHSNRFRIASVLTPKERRETDRVLDLFFKRDGDEWKHDRVEREIVKAQPKIAASRKNGSLGGRPKKTRRETQREPDCEPSNNPEDNLSGKLPSPSPSPSPLAKDTTTDPRPSGQSDGPPSTRQRRRPTNYDQAMEFEIQERATLAVNDSTVMQWTNAHEWPEVIGWAQLFAKAVGWREPNFPTWNDAEVKHIVGLFAKYGVEGMRAARKSAETSDFAKGLKSFSQLSDKTMGYLIEGETKGATNGPGGHVDVTAAERRDALAKAAARRALGLQEVANDG